MTLSALTQKTSRGGHLWLLFPSPRGPGEDGASEVGMEWWVQGSGTEIPALILGARKRENLRWSEFPSAPLDVIGKGLGNGGGPEEGSEVC